MCKHESEPNPRRVLLEQWKDVVNLFSTYFLFSHTFKIAGCIWHWKWKHGKQWKSLLLENFQPSFAGLEFERVSDCKWVIWPKSALPLFVHQKLSIKVIFTFLYNGDFQNTSECIRLSCWEIIPRKMTHEGLYHFTIQSTFLLCPWQWHRSLSIKHTYVLKNMHFQNQSYC